MHGAKKKKGKRKFGGLLASLPPEQNFTWFFDGLQYYERLPIHPPKQGLPANCAIDSCSRGCHVSLCWGPLCPALLFAFVDVKLAVVLDGLAAHQNVRSYEVSFLQEMQYFFLHSYEHKRPLYIGQSDASTTKLANGTRAALCDICCGSCCYWLLQDIQEVSPYSYCCYTYCCVFANVIGWRSCSSYILLFSPRTYGFPRTSNVRRREKKDDMMK